MDVAEPAGVTRGRETILLVDTDPETRKLAAFMLQKRGYAVLEARSAADAIAVYSAYPSAIDLLLTEILLPRMSGLDLAAQLLHSQPGLRILYMSHADYKSPSRQTRLDRERDFLPKPFTMSMLAGKVRDTLDSPRARAAGITP